MHPRCRQAVQQAAGRALTDSKIQKIDDAMSANMRRLARQDPAGWQAKSNDQRVLEAATAGMQDIIQQAGLKVQRAQLQILRTASTESRIGDLMSHYAMGRNAALVRDLEHTESYVRAVKDEYLGRMMDLLNAVKSTENAGPARQGLMFLFDAENPVMSRDLAREIFSNADGSTGNTIAKQGARVWLDTIESMRQRFNDAGGDVGKLDYGYLPQPHDQGLVRGKGDPAAQADWVQKTLPLLDRRQYLRDDGSLMSDQEVGSVLSRAWETIATGGINKMEPGQRRGSSSQANSGSESRQIHFKDGDSYLTYLANYGGGSMYEAMLGHAGGISRDIGLIERYGPNPENQMQLQFDQAKKVDGSVKRVAFLTPQSYWNTVSGKSGSLGENGNAASLAAIGQTTRDIQTFGKLGGATVTSLTDLNTFFITTGYNKLSYWDAIKNIGKSADPETKEFLAMHGVIAESMISDLNRWSGDNVRQNWSGRLANSTMKLSLMNAWTDTMRNAFALTHMNGLAKMSKTEWGRLTEYDRERMIRKGINANDWEIISRAELSEYNGQKFLTPESIRATGDANVNEVVAKVLGMIKDESEYAILNPDLAARTIQTWGGKQRGTVDGELARSVMQFKSFPIAMMTRHWRRVLETPRGLEGAPMLANRGVLSGALLVSLTAMGAVVTQSKEILAGKDPLDMTSAKFWLKAFTQGGGAGFLGDVLLRDSSSDTSSQQGLFELLGPNAGSASALYQLTKGNIDKAAAGKETHAGAETVRFAKGHLPYVNLWYAKAALDHAGLHALQENLSPGYLSRMQQRARKDWGQDYWWKPGTGAPDRTPDFAAMGGK